MSPIKEILAYLKILNASELKVLEQIIFDMRWKLEQRLKEKMIDGAY